VTLLRRSILALAAALIAAAQSSETRLGRKRSTLERMRPERLAAASADVARLAAEWRPLEPLPGLNDYKGIFHAHAEDSAHTGGTLAEMLAEAHRAGVHFIFLGNHYRPPLDFITQTWRGPKEGVLFIPGSEMHGFLLHPIESIMDKMKAPHAELIRATTAGGGLIFLSHVEERLDHPMDGLTGMEIYNRHQDALDDSDSLRAVAEMMTDPESLRRLQSALRLFPDAMLAAQLDYPRLYLEKWDRETQSRRLVGVAANDCHHNQEFVLKAASATSARLGTIVDKDEDMRAITTAQRPGLAFLLRGRRPGDTLARLDFDPYFRSFFNASTHALAPELTEESIRKAVAAGHVYVAHDWMGDPTGFRWAAYSGGKLSGIMGDEVRGEALLLRAELPLPARIRVIKVGAEWKMAEGRHWEAAPAGPGVYRLEAWLSIDGEERPWVYSNPIYIR
jgi:hypothetical protein